MVALTAVQLAPKLVVQSAAHLVCWKVGPKAHHLVVPKAEKTVDRLAWS